MIRTSRALFLALLAPLSAGCGDDHDAHTTDAGHAHDAPADVPVATDVPIATDAPVDVPVAADVPASGPMLNDCAPTDYIDRSEASAERVVRPRGTTGYTPRCVIIRAGQSVTFEMDFAAHPLVPGVPHGPRAGVTEPNLIARQSAGTSYVVAFPGPGNYPFYCDRHGHVGMAGVVRVTP